MALIHANPFSFFTAAQLLRVFTSKIESGTISIGAYGRDGGPGVRFSGDHGDNLKLDAAPADATCIQQFDMRLSAADVAHGTNAIASVFDGATPQVSLCVNADMTLSIMRGDFSGTVLGTSTYAIPVGSYIHVGWKNVIGNSGSSRLEIWEDGDTAPQVVLNLTSVDTQNTGSAQWTAHSIGPSNEGNSDFCNYVVMDGSGSSANDLLGPVDVRALFASARLTPSLTDWSLSSGSDVSALVDDSTPDDDSTYLEETTQNQQMTVGVDPLPSPRTVLGAQLYACVKLTTGTPTLKAIGYQSAAANLGANFSPSASYTYLQQPYSALPDGTAFSTASVFDALEWGLKLTTNTTGARVTQIVVAVIQARGTGSRNVVIGYGNTVTGDDNFVSGQANAVVGNNSQAHGRNATVIGDRSVLINLDGVARSLIGNGKFEVHGVLAGDLITEVSTALRGLAPIITGSDGYVLTKSGAAAVWAAQTGAGGGAPSFEFIEEQTPSGTGTITFSSLGAYTHLEIRWAARSTDGATNVGLLLRVNGDTGANYDSQHVTGNLVTASANESIAATSASIGNISAAGGPSGATGRGTIRLYDYRGTTFNKGGDAQTSWNNNTGSGGTVVRAWGFNWRSTSAIASITLTLAAGNFVAGSKFSLYGLS